MMKRTKIKPKIILLSALSVAVLGLVVATFAGLWQVWLMLPENVHKRKMEAIARIEALGGKVESEGREGTIVAFRVDLAGTNLSDDDLVVLEKCEATIYSLNLSRIPISDRAIEVLARLKLSNNICMLDLSETQITDQALVNAQGLSHLSGLHLSRTKVTNEGMRHLRAMKLDSVSVSGTQVSDEGLQDIASALKARENGRLDISQTSVTDQGMAYLDGLGLMQLNLSGTKVTDAGLNKLKALLPTEWVTFQAD
jgi:hypothetical protein